MKNGELEEKVLKKVRLNIAISEFEKDYITKENKNGQSYLHLGRKAAIIILTLGVIVLSGVQAKNVITEFEDREPTYIVESISNAINNGYVEKLNMEYEYSDRIGLRINSLSMSSNNINFVLDFKLDNGIKLEDKNIEYGYILYNQNNEVYHIKNGTNRNLFKKFLKEKHIKDNNVDSYYLSAQSSYITKKQDNIVINESISAKDYFPKAEKLYLWIAGIGYKTDNGKYKPLSNSEWIIEIEIPEKFYESTNIEYTLKENVQGIEIEKIFISDTSMTFIAHIEGINGKNNVSVIDENGNQYIAKAISYDGDTMTTEFAINKDRATQKLFIKTIIDNEEKVIELVKK